MGMEKGKRRVVYSFFWGGGKGAGNPTQEFP